MEGEKKREREREGGREREREEGVWVGGNYSSRRQAPNDRTHRRSHHLSHVWHPEGTSPASWCHCPAVAAMPPWWTHLMLLAPVLAPAGASAASGGQVPSRIVSHLSDEGVVVSAEVGVMADGDDMALESELDKLRSALSPFIRSTGELAATGTDRSAGRAEFEQFLQITN